MEISKFIDHSKVTVKYATKFGQNADVQSSTCKYTEFNMQMYSIVKSSTTYMMVGLFFIHHKVLVAVPFSRHCFLT